MTDKVILHLTTSTFCMNYKDVIDFLKPNQTKKMTIRNWYMNAVWNKLWLEPTLFFCCLDHILNLFCLLLSVQGSYKRFLLVRKNDCMVLIKYERVTSISRKKKTKIKICRSVQVLTIIQLTTSIFFSPFTYLHDTLQE